MSSAKNVEEYSVLLTEQVLQNCLASCCFSFLFILNDRWMFVKFYPQETI